MFVRFWNERMSPFLRHVATVTGSLAISLGLIWNISRPHAEIFVKEVVAQERFASQSALDSIDDRAKRLEKASKDMLERQEEQAVVQGRLEADLSILKELQKEQREDIKNILKAVR